MRQVTSERLHKSSINKHFRNIILLAPAYYYLVCNLHVLFYDHKFSNYKHLLYKLKTTSNHTKNQYVNPGYFNNVKQQTCALVVLRRLQSPKQTTSYIIQLAFPSIPTFTLFHEVFQNYSHLYLYTRSISLQYLAYYMHELYQSQL